MDNQDVIKVKKGCKINGQSRCYQGKERMYIIWTIKMLSR